jgi:hypothetical protein
MKSILYFFDKLEDKIRGRLSHYPILYAFIGAVGVVIFWRGIWHTADFISEVIFSFQMTGSLDIGSLPWWDGPLSIVVGGALLLSTGLFVFGFIGNEAIISGLKGEKRLAEKTEEEVRAETGVIKEIKDEVKEISRHLDEMEKEMEQKSNRE